MTMQGVGSLTAYSNNRVELKGTGFLGQNIGILTNNESLLDLRPWPDRLIPGASQFDRHIEVGYHHWYEIDLVAGITYDILALGYDDFDSQMYLFRSGDIFDLSNPFDPENSSAGVFTVTHDDYSDDTLNLNVTARIIWTATETGKFYLLVRGYDDEESGDYILTAHEMPVAEVLTASSALYGIATVAFRSFVTLPAMGSQGGVSNPGSGQIIEELPPLFETGAGGFYIPPQPVLGYGNLPSITAQGHIIQTNPMTGDVTLGEITSKGGDYAYGEGVVQIPPLRGLGISQLATTGLVTVPQIKVTGTAEFQNNFINTQLPLFSVNLTARGSDTFVLATIPLFSIEVDLGATIEASFPAPSITLVVNTPDVGSVLCCVPSLSVQMLGGAEMSLAMPKLSYSLESHAQEKGDISAGLPLFNVKGTVSVAGSVAVESLFPMFRMSLSASVRPSSQINMAIPAMSVVLAGKTLSAGLASFGIPLFTVGIKASQEVAQELEISIPMLSFSSSGAVPFHYGILRHNRNTVN